MIVRDQRSGLYVPDRRVVRHRQPSPLWQGGQQQVMLAQRIAGGGGFAPPDIAGCELWLPADYIVGLSDGDPVSTWDDESGNGNDATSSGGARPLYQTNEQNGLPALQFDGTDDFIGGSRGSLTDVTIFAVLKQNSAAGFASAYDIQDGAFDGLWLTTLLLRNGGDFVDTGEAFATYKLLVITAPNGGTSTAYINGVSAGTVGSVAPSGTTYRMGATLGGGNFAAQFVAEFGLYDSVLGGSDLTDLTTYAMDKYAL